MGPPVVRQNCSREWAMGCPGGRVGSDVNIAFTRRIRMAVSHVDLTTGT